MALIGFLITILGIGVAVRGFWIGFNEHATLRDLLTRSQSQEVMVAGVGSTVTYGGAGIGYAPPVNPTVEERLDVLERRAKNTDVALGKINARLDREVASLRRTIEQGESAARVEAFRQGQKARMLAIRIGRYEVVGFGLAVVGACVSLGGSGIRPS